MTRLELVKYLICDLTSIIFDPKTKTENRNDAVIVLGIYNRELSLLLNKPQL